MESALSPDKKPSQAPINEYQWDNLRTARKLGCYPWTHLLKPPLQGEITAEDIIRESTPRRSMSRELPRSRTHSPVDGEGQIILNLDSSPGSSRRHGEKGKDEGIHIPKFSKEVSLDSEDDIVNQAINTYIGKQPESQPNAQLVPPIVSLKNVSPKGILKRRIPEQKYIGFTETREKTKCCHPLVNKIKHLADRTLNKFEKNECETSPSVKRKKNKERQEIRQLKTSPGAVRRQKFSAIKLGDSDEMSKIMSINTLPSRKKKDHIYEVIENSKDHDPEKSPNFTPDEDKIEQIGNNQNESLQEKNSIGSQDPSLEVEDETSLNSEEYIMEKLHKVRDSNKEAILLDEETDPEELNFDEIFQNQLEEIRPNNDSPNITITAIFDDDVDEPNHKQVTVVPTETSPTSPRASLHETNNVESFEKEWSKPSSDHEYEIIENLPPNTIHLTSSVDARAEMVKPGDELPSTISLERKYLQHNSDEEEFQEEKDIGDSNKAMLIAPSLQKDIAERYFINTPSTTSRTECEISTSQVDSSALEKLPLKRDSRSKRFEGIDAKIQQRIKEGTGNLKTQASKLKTKLQIMKTKQFNGPEKPKTSLPERPKFKIPERPKFTLPERHKFTLPDKRKFSLPDRPRFKKINISEKLSFGDKKKFTLTERPAFKLPDFSKLKLPEKSKLSFFSLGKKNDPKIDETGITGSSTDLRMVAPVEFEARTYPRLFNRKKKTELLKTSSSPNLDIEETLPPKFTVTQIKKNTIQSSTYIPDNQNEPQEYGHVKNLEMEMDERPQFETTYDFDKLHSDSVTGVYQVNHNKNKALFTEDSLSKEEYVINEINNDEFFVRPRGISSENIQVREYLSNEIRQAFKIPKNALALMGNDSGVNDENIYANEPEASPELLQNDHEHMRYSYEDLNDRDDGYYTFPPVRPSRAKRKKNDLEFESVRYIDENTNNDMQFSDIDLCLSEDRTQYEVNDEIEMEKCHDLKNQLDCCSSNELRSIHEYPNDDVIQYPENIPIQFHTLPMPPQRKKKIEKKDFRRSSLNDFIPAAELWEECPKQREDIIVYRTEYECIVPQTKMAVTENSPLPPRRNRSRSSRGTSLCDDDRTSHGAESLTLDSHLPPTDYIESDRGTRHESSGYATVDKIDNVPSKAIRLSRSKTPPIKCRKSNGSERKYFTVGVDKKNLPDRPPRKKSSTSLMNMDNFSKRSVSADFTQYFEINEHQREEYHKDLNSGEVVSKMKDRPLPPPPRPPRVSKKKSSDTKHCDDIDSSRNALAYSQEDIKMDDVVEIEVSTQTDPLPDYVVFELGIGENLELSKSSSLKDIANDESYGSKTHGKKAESPRISRPTSRSEKSFKFSDHKIAEMSKSNIGRTSPTVILVERRVSSPTRINACDEMLTEASLTVQHIDIDKSPTSNVPTLLRPKSVSNISLSSRKMVLPGDDQALDRVSDTNRDVQLDNLVTQRLQVRDLDVGRLNVSEIQTSKVLVSDIESMTLQVAELDSKAAHMSVSGIEFSQSVIDEIVKKFAEISTSATVTQAQDIPVSLRPIVREEQTQTDEPHSSSMDTERKTKLELNTFQSSTKGPPTPPPTPLNDGEAASPPQRPPPPDLTPFLYSYLQDITLPPASFYHRTTPLRERPFTEFHETHHQSPPSPTRRAKRRPVVPHSESSSNDDRTRPSPKHMPIPVKKHEPTITEAGAQFLRVCHNSISRTIRNIFNSFVSYVSRNKDKNDVQMALVIMLVLIAGLVMFGLSDSRTIHHHHWDFFNPPDGKQ